LNARNIIGILLSVFVIAITACTIVYIEYRGELRTDRQGFTVVTDSNYPASGIELANGSILATWSTLHDDYDNSSNINGSLSGDGGMTWSSPPFVLVKNQGNRVTEEQYVYNNGDLYGFYASIDETNASEGIEPSSLYIVRSLDGSVTRWGGPVLIANSTNLFSITSPPIKLTSGRWVVPIQYRDPLNISHGYSSVFYSDDNFTTWKQGGKINNDGVGLWELSIAQTNDGGITGLLRYDSLGMYFWQTRSYDGGITWSAPVRSSIPSPNARPHIMKLNDGSIILVWNNNQHLRNPLSIALLNESATGILKSKDIAKNGLGFVYHNLGVLQRSDGNIVILAATDGDIDWAYWQLPFGMRYVYSHASGIKSYIVDKREVSSNTFISW
jgi:hypothetical protein